MATKKQQKEPFFQNLSSDLLQEENNFAPRKPDKNPKKQKIHSDRHQFSFPKLSNKTLKKVFSGKKILPLIILYLFSFPSLFGGFYEQGGYQGFYFFEETQKKEEKSTIKKDSLPKTPEEALVFLKSEKARLEALQALAICNPTKENLTNFFEQRNQMIGLASNFADQGMFTLLERADLGPDPKFPKNDFGIEFRKNLEQSKQKETLKNLGEQFFLLVVGEGGEPWSEMAATIGETFANATKWTVRFLSLNGEKSTSDLKTEFNRSLLEKISLRETPSFFMIDPQNETIIPVGSGAPSVSLLFETILEQASRHALLENSYD